MEIIEKYKISEDVANSYNSRMIAFNENHTGLFFGLVKVLYEILFISLNARSVMIKHIRDNEEKLRYIRSFQVLNRQIKVLLSLMDHKLEFQFHVMKGKPLYNMIKLYKVFSGEILDYASSFSRFFESSIEFLKTKEKSTSVLSTINYLKDEYKKFEDLLYLYYIINLTHDKYTLMYIENIDY